VGDKGVGVEGTMRGRVWGGGLVSTGMLHSAPSMSGPGISCPGNSIRSIVG